MENPLTVWSFYPSVIIGVLALLGLYLAAYGPLRQRLTGSEVVEPLRLVAFVVALAAILIALISPLDELGDTYLFSAHMVQHLLLTVVAAPLLIIGSPDWMLRPILTRPIIRPIIRFLTQPVTALIIYNVIYIGWHFPVFYQAALENENIHIIQHLSFIAASVIGWWPILSRMPEFPALEPVFQIAYLFGIGVPTTILSIILAFSPAIFYPYYANAPIRLFGLSVAADQRTGGVIMWLSEESAYFLAITLTFFQWMRQEEKAQKLRDDDEWVTESQHVNAS